MTVKIPGIPAAIERPIGELTLRDTAVIIIRAGIPGFNEWQFVPTNEPEVYAIKNIVTGTYLGFDGEPEPGLQLRGNSRPRDWFVEQVDNDSGSLSLILRLNEDRGLVVGISLAKIFPPLAALEPKREGNEQAWNIHFHE